MLFLVATLLFAQLSWAAPRKNSRRLPRQASTNTSGNRSALQDPEQDGAEEVLGRQEWFYGQRKFGLGYIPIGARARALEQRRRMQVQEQAARISSGIASTANVVSTGAASSTTWTLLGPQPLSTTFGWGNTSGRVSALVVDPTNSSVVYLGAAQGGVWKSTNGGTSWTPLTDDQPSLAIGSLAINPNNSSVIYAGTGEENFSGDSYYGQGILKSTDGGSTWTQLAGIFAPPSTAPAYIGSVAVEPGNSSVLLAAVGTVGVVTSGTGYVARSADGGATWTKVLNASSGHAATSVFFDPSNGSIAYAALQNGGVYRSADGGQTWTQLTGSGSNLFPTTNVGRIELAIASSTPTTLYASVATASPLGNLLGVYKTTDSGSNWTQVTAAPNYCGTADLCWYANAIAVDPVNANVVFAGGSFDASGFLNLVQTTNGGSSWSLVSNNTQLHVDLHALAFSADGKVLYVGNDGGVWSTSNPNTSSLSWSNLNGGLSTTQFYPNIGLHPTSTTTVFGGTQDNGMAAGSGTLTWSEVNCGDGSSAAIDYNHTSTVYINCSRVNIQKSTTGGGNGTYTQMISGITTSDRAAFIPPLIMDPVNPSILYFGTFRLYQTTNGASSWSAISTDLTGGSGNISSMAVSKSDNNVVYVGTSSGKVQMTSNALSGTSATFTNVSTGLPVRAVTSIAVDPTNPANVFVTFSGFNTGHVFQSTNSGGTWTNISGNLPNIPANAIVFDPDNANTLYVGTDIGVMKTADGGNTWSTLVTGLPNAAVLALGLQESNRLLFAGTHGRGVWTLSVPVVVTTGTTTVLASGTNPSVFGQGVTFTATVTRTSGSGTPTGSVVFKDGTTTLGTGILSGGVATLVDSALSLGSHSISASYAGDSNFSASSSSSLTQTVNAAATSTTVASSTNPSVFGQSVTFTATVSTTAPGSGTPTGTVTFKDGTTSIGTGTLSAGSATFNTSSLAVGSHSITAVYAATADFAGSTSSALTQTVNQASSTTTVVSSVNPSVFGRSVMFTATVSAVAPGGGTPTGTVTFKDGTTTLGTGTLSAGMATFNSSSLTIGSHSVTAVYGADTNFTASTSSVLSQTVNKGNSATAVVSSANPSGSGQSVTFTATVSASAPAAGTPSGTVTFKDGTTTLGTGTLSAGSATFATSSLSVGTHSITAVYGGDANFNTSTSSVLAQTVNSVIITTTTAVVSSANPSVFGQSVTFTATVTPTSGSNTPTGTVTFKDGTTTLGTGTLSSGSATFNTSALTVGSHSITAVYSGDTNFSGSTSSVLTQTVNQASTTTAVVSATNPSVFGQSVMFTATVSVVAPGAGTPTGTVTFKDGTTTLGTGTLSAGSATFSTSSLTVGSHSITAAYGATTNFASSTSSALTQTVNQASTSSALVSSVNPSVFGQSVTFTATVTVVAPGGGTPTGTVTFKDGTTTLGTGTLSSGSASFNTSSLAVGSHSITATYGGSTSFSAGTSSAVSQTVNKAVSTTVVVSSLNPSTAGQSVIFTASVTAVAPGAGSPTGTVTFKDGTTTLGTGTLSSGSATFTTSSLTAGSHSITASYGGDGNFNASTSSTLTQSVGSTGTTTTLLSSKNPSVFGQSVTFTATVTPTTGSGTPTGTVTFKDGTTTLATGTLSTGSATFATSSLSVGTHSITAVYGGDTKFAGSTSSALSQTVNQASTTTVVVSSANPSVFGQSVTLTATVSAVAPGGGTPTGTVTFKDGTTTLGTGTLSSGSATFSTATLALGTHSITAVYGAATNFGGSTSSTLTQTVNQGSTTTAVVSSGNPSVFGQSITFTATVSAVAPGAGMPTGTVTFKDGTTTLGTGTLSAGVATFNSSSLAIGSHSITADYSGSPNFGSSTSSTLTQTVNQAGTTTAFIVSVNPSVFGQQVTFTATVSVSAPGSGIPSGTVTFKDGTTTLGTGTLSTGSATFSTPSLSVGTHSITAAYGGSSSFGSSTSSALTQTVNAATTSTTLTSSWNPAQTGGSITFTAHVSAVMPGSGVPGGSITFKDNATTLSTVTLSGGSASFATSALSAGIHPITAVYSGSSSFNGSTSNTVSQSVTAQLADLSVSVAHSPTTRAVAIGGKLTEIIVVSSASSTPSQTYSSTAVTVTINASGNFVLNSMSAVCSGTAPITCNVGSISPGQQASPISINLTPLLGHDLSVQVTATGTTADPALGNNSATDPITVQFKPFAR